jgi:hypothetical protein
MRRIRVGEIWRVAIIVGTFCVVATGALWLGLNYLAGTW